MADAHAEIAAIRTRRDAAGTAGDAATLSRHVLPDPV